MATTPRNRRDDGDEGDAIVAVPIPVSSFIQNASHAIPVAGLLADQPELRDELHTREEWAELLDAYLTSPRP